MASTQPPNYTSAYLSNAKRAFRRALGEPRIESALYAKLGIIWNNP
jgi:hypothetical protein